MDTMLMAAITAGTPAALAEAVAALPFERVEAYESDGGRILIGRVGCTVLTAMMASECGCGNPDHDNGFKITLLAASTVEGADETINRNLALIMGEAQMLATVTGQSVLRPITERNLAAPVG